MSLILSGTNGLSDVDGSAATPAIRGTDTNTGIFFPAADTIAFAEGGVEAMRLDSSGNLGLGVTPSAWSANRLALQIGGSSGGYVTANSGLAVASNYYYSSGDKFVANGYAPLYYMSSGNGQHQWYTSNNNSSGAGAAVSLTQAMTLDASGNLGVGVTSISSDTPLHVKKTGDNAIMKVESSAYSAILNLINGGATEVSTVRASGSNNVLTFQTGTTERARIDSSGNLLVGTTSYSYPLSVVKATTNSRVGYFRADTSSYTDSILILDTTTSAGTSCRFIEGYSGSASLQFRVYNNGNVQNTNNSYGSISDVKLKENIVDATPKLADLMQVKVRSYNLKESPNQKQIGVIAQELEQVFPSMVDESPDFDAEGNNLGTTTKSVKYSVFVPMLIKAIQEQQALITQLQADVAALKGQA